MVVDNLTEQLERTRMRLDQEEELSFEQNGKGKGKAMCKVRGKSMGKPVCSNTSVGNSSGTSIQ